MAINIIRTEITNSGKFMAWVTSDAEPDESYSLKFPEPVSNAEIKDVARIMYQNKNEAARLLRRADRIAARIQQKLEEQGIAELAIQEVDTEGVI